MRLLNLKQKSPIHNLNKGRELYIQLTKFTVGQKQEIQQNQGLRGSERNFQKKLKKLLTYKKSGDIIPFADAKTEARGIRF